MLFWRWRWGNNQIHLTKCEVDMFLKCRCLQLGCFACGMMEISSCGSWISDSGDTDRLPSVEQWVVSPRGLMCHPHPTACHQSAIAPGTTGTMGAGIWVGEGYCDFFSFSALPSAWTSFKWTTSLLVGDGTEDITCMHVFVVSTMVPHFHLNCVVHQYCRGWTVVILWW